MSTHEIHQRDRSHPTARRFRVATGVLATILVLAGCGDSDTDEGLPIDVADAPSDEDAFGASEPVVLPPRDAALAASSEYIDAFNGGDADAVLALLTPDVELSEKYTGMSPDFETLERADFEQHLAWSTAQGTTFTSPECSVTDDSSGAGVNVSCEFGWLYAAEKAAGKPPVPTTLDLVVAPDGISQLAFEYLPEFGVTSFDRWLLVNHPDDSQGVEFGDWNSVAEAQQGGTLRAQYVAEWAAELEAGS